MWFGGCLVDREGLEKIMGRKGKGLEIEMWEVMVEIMESVGRERLWLWEKEIVVLVVDWEVKVEKEEVRKVLEECWKVSGGCKGVRYRS